MMNDRQGKFYVAAAQAIDARETLLRWLGTGVLKVTQIELVKVTGCRLVYLPFCEVECSYVAPWEADLGRVDSGPYQTAINHYRVAAAQFESLPESVRHHNRRPVEPNEADYVQWSHFSDRVTGHWKSGISVVGHPTEYHLDARVPEWAESLRTIMKLPDHAIWYNTFESWSTYAGSTREHLLQPMPEAFLVKEHLPKVYKQIQRQLSGLLPKYRSNLNVNLSDETKFDLTNWIIIPVYVIDYQVGQKKNTCLVDAICGTNITGGKIHDLKGAISRFFNAPKAWFGRAKTPKMITYDPKPDAGQMPSPASNEELSQPRAFKSRKRGKVLGALFTIWLLSVVGYNLGQSAASPVAVFQPPGELPKTSSFKFANGNVRTLIEQFCNAKGKKAYTSCSVWSQPDVNGSLMGYLTITSGPNGAYFESDSLTRDHKACIVSGNFDGEKLDQHTDFSAHSGINSVISDVQGVYFLKRRGNRLQLNDDASNYCYSDRHIDDVWYLLGTLEM